MRVAVHALLNDGASVSRMRAGYSEAKCVFRYDLNFNRGEWVTAEKRCAAGGVYICRIKGYRWQLDNDGCLMSSLSPAVKRACSKCIKAIGNELAGHGIPFDKFRANGECIGPQPWSIQYFLGNFTYLKAIEIVT